MHAGGLLRSVWSGLVAGLGSGVVLENLDGFTSLGVEGVNVFEQVKEFGVVHFEEHAGDLPGLFGVRLLNEREQSLSEHLLLLGVGGRGKCRGGERLLALGEQSWLRHLLLHWHLLHRHVWSVWLSTLLWLRLTALASATGATSWVAASAVALLAWVPWDACHAWHHAALHDSVALLLLLLHHHLLLLSHELWTTLSSGHAGWVRVPAWDTLCRHATLHHVHAAWALPGHARLREHGLLHSQVIEPLVVRHGDLSTTFFLSLRKGDVERLLLEDLSVHLGDCLCGFVGRVEADEPEPLGGAIGVSHDLGRGDGSELFEGLSDLIV